MVSPTAGRDGAWRRGVAGAAIVAVYTALIGGVVWSAASAVSPGTAGRRQQLRSLGLSDTDAKTAAAAVGRNLREQWLWSTLIIGVLLAGWVLFRRFRGRPRSRSRRSTVIGVAVGLAVLLPALLFVVSVASDAIANLNQPSF